jgi:hypothetical protein
VWPAELPDDNRELEPPDPMPNSEVKRFIADGSVGFPHVRVGHRQASNEKPSGEIPRVFLCAEITMEIEITNKIILDDAQFEVEGFPSIA